MKSTDKRPARICADARATIEIWSAGRIGRSTSMAALPALLWAAPAHAQDASILFVAALPPVLLTPAAVALLRCRWVRRVSGARPSCPRMFMWAGLEVILWFLVAGSATLVWVAERTILIPIFLAAAALAAGWYGRKSPMPDGGLDLPGSAVWILATPVLMVLISVGSYGILAFLS